MRLSWSDGRVSRYHAVWLRDNAPDGHNLNPETREQRTDVTGIPADPRMISGQVDAAGALDVRWQDGGLTSRFHPGWLYHHDYTNGPTTDPANVDPILWDSGTMSEPPTFSGTGILQDDDLLEAWLRAVAVHGITRLRNVTSEAGMVARVGERIGPVRTSNFSRVFDVRVQPGPKSNAYTSLALTPHTDLPTREYQPGLQLLHCLRANGSGGQAIMVDGYRLATYVRETDPAAYEALTEIGWPTSNRAADTDYRWASPVICLDEAGGIEETAGDAVSPRAARRPVRAGARSLSLAAGLLPGGRRPDPADALRLSPG